MLTLATPFLKASGRATLAPPAFILLPLLHSILTRTMPRSGINLHSLPPAGAAGDRGCSGFTILEVLVVIIVIGIALTLLLPAMLDARESARRVQCQNNLKQAALALHNYHDMHAVFPPGYIARNVTPGETAQDESGPGYAWSALLLPFLDQVALFRTIDFSVDPLGSTAVAKPMISCYRCPSAGDEQASYVGSFGSGSLTESPGRPAGPGVFYRNSKVQEFDIRDGSSSTFLIGERAGVHDFVPGAEPAPAGAVWLALPTRAFRPAGVPVAGVVEGPASFVLANVGQDEPFAVHAVHGRTNHVAAFSSGHPGGANFALCDGAVVFVSSDIDYDVYRRLGQRSDHEFAEVPRAD